ncbi:hypothetical protein ACH5A7_20890 [Streptomyces sp. NPDC018955]|uniref:hypothetical protein n=1 Tax=Streptomyces sp. NPDC018955 TaxID=3365055 RepID=UPI0037B8B937
MSLPAFEPLENLPSARKRITAELLAHGWERADIEEALDGFASELAGEIRKERDAMREEMKDSRSGITKADLDAMSYAANVIDPYPVDPREEPTT